MATNLRTVDVDARIRTQAAIVTNSGSLGLSMNASAVAGNAIATADFLDTLVFESVSLPSDFLDPDVNLDNLMIQFDTGLVLPIQVESSVIPESSSMAIWSLLGALGFVFWYRRKTIRLHTAAETSPRA